MQTESAQPLRQLRMRRSLSEPLPALPPFAPGLEIVAAVAANGPAAWERIIADSFGRAMSYDMIRNDATCAPERVFLLLADGEPAATAAAQYPAQPGLGVVHMVGVHSRFLGHGYGQLMVLRVLQTMQEDGRIRAELTTDDFRLPAIRTYLKLGFEPVMEDDTMPARWAQVHANLAAYRKTVKPE